MTLALAAVTAVMGVLVGIFSALFGVGGGIVMVPFMVLVLGLTQHVSEGTSLLVIVPTALAGAIAHHKRGYLDGKGAITLAAGGVVGAFLGALLSLELPGEVLRNLFAALVAVVGVRLVVDGLRNRGSPSESPS